MPEDTTTEVTESTAPREASDDEIIAAIGEATEATMARDVGEAGETGGPGGGSESRAISPQGVVDSKSSSPPAASPLPPSSIPLDQISSPGPIEGPPAGDAGPPGGAGLLPAPVPPEGAEVTPKPVLAGADEAGGVDDGSPAPGHVERVIDGVTYQVSEDQVAAFDAQQLAVDRAKSAQSTADAGLSLANSRAGVIQRELEAIEARLGSGGQGIPAGEGPIVDADGSAAAIPDFSVAAEVLDQSLGANGEVKKFAQEISASVKAQMAAAIGPVGAQIEELRTQNAELARLANSQVAQSSAGGREATLVDYYAARGETVDERKRTVFAELEAKATQLLSERAAAEGRSISILDVQAAYPTIIQVADNQILREKVSKQPIGGVTRVSRAGAGTIDPSGAASAGPALTPSGSAGHAGTAPRVITPSGLENRVAPEPDGSLESMLASPDQVRFLEQD